MGVSSWIRSRLGGNSALRMPKLGAISVSREAAAAAAPRLIEMQQELQRLAELPGIEGFAETHQLPVAFSDQMDRALAAYDAFIAGLVANVPLAVTCRIGCTHCCCDVPTPVRGIELLNIYRVVRERGGYRKVHNRSAELAGQFSDMLVEASGGRTSVKSDSKPFVAAQLAFLARAEPCAFLHPKKKTCTIYDVRPITCRMHFSVDDPALCDPNHPGDDDPTTPNLAPPEPLAELMRNIDRRMGLSVSQVLPVGFAELGANVMAGEKIRWSHS